jgi:nucleoside-diphosphate-sugar epimerase
MFKRVLITGGCGFIGSNLTKNLVKKGWKIDVIDDMSNGHLELLEGLKMRVVPIDLLTEFESSKYKREDSTVLVMQGDFAHPEIKRKILEKSYDVIFHQAAVPRVSYSVEQPSLTTNVNIAKTVALFDAARSNVDRIVWASSSSVYGGADDLPTPESYPKDPKSPYAWQKSAIEDVAKLFGNLYSLDIVCLRYFNVFGPGQYGDSPYSTAVSAWCHGIANKTPLRSDGDGSQSRDMCYIDNVVSANVLAAEASMKFMGKTYNVACGDRTENREILAYLQDRYPGAVVNHAPWRPGDVMHTKADISSIQNDLGYEPIVRFWEGLERTLEWWNI